MLKFAPLLIIIISMFASRSLNNRANRSLSPEKRSQLVELFSRPRLVLVIASVVVLGLFMANMEYQWLPFMWSVILFIGAFIIYFITNMLSTRKKLKEADFDPSYIRMTLQASIIRLVGFVIAFVMIMFQYWQNMEVK